MSKAEKKMVPRNQLKSFKDRKTFWYTVNELMKNEVCPSCGRSMNKFKNITAHVKRCFSIKKIGPIYRLHGYNECICGLLIADNAKAKKLHLCTGEVPAFEPELNYEQLRSSSNLSNQDDQSTGNQILSSPHLERELLQPKPWIRNFVSPFKLDIENVQDNTKSEPRVRNFDMASNNLEPEPHNVSVYSIGSNNGAIFVRGHSGKSQTTNFILKRDPRLRLPSLKYS
ncbi:uncharacterized protein LOC117784064 [Drosophila innubila]|uniref:uncharacterized protein LOC117784064 n=1 Tax=Drosophila innubila TaxID=198719 RepID=UPI00148B86E6|nr:uncharacterized protein LOC117784064 [Drosophila innubila]XP_034477556.1 uncharacterized protein LOC117784064 [Drosophila innubila]XP_034477557.1 uncharacterized protein LOC117784064 [Drosophila innubila]